MRLSLLAAASGIALAAAASPVSAAVVADFVADYQEPTPATGWAYQWNPNGVPGGNADPSGWANLQFNGDFYDSNGQPGLPDPAPASFVLVSDGIVHPGRGTNQAGAEYSAITSYTLATAGQVSVTNLSATDQDANGGFGAAVVVGTVVGGVFTQAYANAWPNGGGITQPTIPLGTLAAGDRVVVAVVPNGDDEFDGTFLGYQVDVTPVPEPASLGLLALGGLGLLARRRA